MIGETIGMAFGDCLRNRTSVARAISLFYPLSHSSWQRGFSFVRVLVGDRFYWLKLGTDFFNSDDMKVVLSQTNGHEYAIFWIKLLLKAVQQSDPGLLRFKPDIPYKPETLATVTDTDIDTVSNAIQLFQRLGMLRVAENGDIWLESVNEMIGSETTSAKRVRAFRARQSKALQSNGAVTPKKLEKSREKKEKKKTRENLTHTRAATDGKPVPREEAVETYFDKLKRELQ